MRQCFFNLIDQYQAEITRFEPFKGDVNGVEFAMDFLDVLGPFGIYKSKLQQGKHFTISAAALALILIEHDVVKSIAKNLGLLTDVLITPVARAANDD